MDRILPDAVYWPMLAAFLGVPGVRLAFFPKSVNRDRARFGRGGPGGLWSFLSSPTPLGTQRLLGVVCLIAGVGLAAWLLWPIAGLERAAISPR